VVDTLHGWEMAADDALRCLHHPLEGLAISSGAAAEPGSNAAREDAPNAAPVKASESFCELKDEVGAVCGYTVIRVQGIQEWTEYIALRGSGAQGRYRVGETAHSHLG